jgi:rod shape-determining protein MreD
MIISAGGTESPSAGAIVRAPRLWMVAVLVVVAVLLQVSLMPFINIAGGIPDVLVCVIVAVGLLRGPLVGAVAGAAGGFLVELTSPVGTLGVLALLYLVVGWGAGRLCGRDEMRGLLPPVVLCVIAEAVVQIGEAFVQLMLSRPLDFGDVVRILLASAILTGLIAAPVVAVARRTLGAPRVVEPYAIPGDG